MSYNTFANVTVVNNFSSPANIVLSHIYSNDDPVSNNWSNVENGLPGAPTWQVGYNTGFVRYGTDSWHVQVDVLSGEQQGSWESDTVSCMLRPEDASGTLYFSVAPSGFNIHMNSGSCSYGINKVK